MIQSAMHLVHFKYLMHVINSLQLSSNTPGQLLRRTEILPDFGPQQSFPEMCGFRSLLGEFGANGHIACETTWFPVGFPLSRDRKSVV